MKRLLIASALLAGLGASHAAPMVFFGENQAACATPGVRATCSVSGNPLSARNSFLAQLSGVSTENFETYANDDGQAGALASLFTGSAGNITATINSPGNSSVSNGTSTSSFTDTENFGRWNTAPGGGSQWYTAFDTFTIDFDQAISAFGFYGTDVGDFNGSMTVTLTRQGGGTEQFTVGHTVNGANGALMFWGFVDLAGAYTSISFGNSSSGFDGFGFDAMTIGDAGQIRGVPEPTGLALALGALALAGCSRRRAR